MSLAPMLSADHHSTGSSARPLLVITEGVFDIACLVRLSQIAKILEPDLPDLQHLAEHGRMVFLPAGGGDLAAWTFRLAPLGCPEFFLCDREQEPESSLRQDLVAGIDRRPGCRAVMTSKRSLENYLHPQAIKETFGVTVTITDDLSVAEAVARAHPDWRVLWPTLSHRARRRLIYRTKRRLNLETVHYMTAELLAERDPAGEVCGWFRDIARLLTAGR